MLKQYAGIKQGADVSTLLLQVIDTHEGHVPFTTMHNTRRRNTHQLRLCESLSNLC